MTQHTLHTPPLIRKLHPLYATSHSFPLPSPPLPTLHTPHTPYPPHTTDSVFVHLKGRSKEEAFRIGKEMAESITALSPPNVVLKFEKVYLPCILLSKKR